MNIKMIALAGIGLSVIAISPAMAQRAQRPPGELTITNARAAQMVSLEIATNSEPPKLVARVTKPLPAGRSVKVKLNGARGCSYVVLAKFADDSESYAEDMNLCGERQIRLTEE